MDEKIVDSTLRQLAHKKRTVKDLISFLSNKCEETSNYTLLIGAGCSVTSGIDSGGDLIKKWKKEIYESENTEGVKMISGKASMNGMIAEIHILLCFKKNMIYHVNVVFL